MKLRGLLLVVTLAGSLLLTNSSFAAIEIAKWIVCSTTKIDAYNGSTPAPHGLWTNDFIAGDSYLNYFDIQANTFLTQFDDGTATLIGSAKNLGGVVAQIDLLLSGFQTSLANPATEYKQESGGPYNAAVQDFYASVSGVITFVPPNSAISIISTFGGTFFQIGDGANAKTNTPNGASSWLLPKQGSTTLNHWDLNLDLKPTPPGGNTPVPEAASLMIWSLIIGMGAKLTHRRRDR